MRWGLIPPWAKDKSIGAKLANARAETIDEKPSFQQPFQRRRCLLPVDGYYEWESRPSGKQPVYYSMRDGDLFCLAGLWETWTPPEQTDKPELPGLGLDQAEAGTLYTFTVVTTTPNRLAKRVHERMPVIVHPADYGNWLLPESKAADLKRLLRPFDDEPMQEHYVTPLMNNPRFEAPKCIEPIIN
jgi:putative SOS response-associated peptidase YedK